MKVAKFKDGPLTGKHIFVEELSSELELPVVNHKGVGYACYSRLEGDMYMCSEFVFAEYGGIPTIGPEAEKYVPVYASDEKS